MSNRLISEKSPYLLHHSDNPVNWYPWGEEAFEYARSADKPIFLSIGYSTCHWCHVMAEESFADREIADILNESFVSVKVDSEERQDVDTVYMSVCEAMTGSGGWPLTIIMTPDKKPFFAATYMPKESGYDMGLKEVLLRTARLWKTDKNRLISSADEIIGFIRRPRLNTYALPSKKLIANCVKELMLTFDKDYGGFGKAPKFPVPHKLLFLIDYALQEKDEQALEMVQKTLDYMYRGGIFDHIGGGFSRYSTDAEWLVPHFEKTLYDNALLSMCYAETYRLTYDPFYKKVCELTVDYVLRELKSENNGFYCGQDADSEGVEGKYYTFTKDEIISLLGNKKGKLFCERYDIKKDGSFDGKNIPNLLNTPDFRKTDDDTASSLGLLYNYRLQRIKLLKDTKILTSWNSMMIAALARAAFIMKRPDYLKAAKEAQIFIEERLTTNDGKLYVRFCDGEAANDGTIDDYAFYAYALIMLYKTTLDCDYLIKAVWIADRMLSLFFDEQNGGFYLYSKEAQQLINRPKETFDRAIPSGNSAAAQVLTSLSFLTGDEKWRKLRDLQLKFLSGPAYDYPSAHCFALTAIMSVVNKSTGLVCVTGGDFPQELYKLLLTVEVPNLYVLAVTKENQEKLSAAAPYIKDYPIPESGTDYYICINGACKKPIKDISEVRNILKQI